MTKLTAFTVEQYMTPQAVVVDSLASLKRAISIMDENRLSMLPVVNSQQQVVGVLSASDLIEITREIQSDLSALILSNDDTQEFLKKLLITDGTSTLVKDVMSAPAVTLQCEMTLVAAAKQLINYHYHHLPVVDHKGEPVGVISTTDFVRAFAENEFNLQV